MLDIYVTIFSSGYDRYLLVYLAVVIMDIYVTIFSSG